jgi:hypothetical protein
MRILRLLLTLFLSFSAGAQEWSLRWTIPVSEDAVWDADQSGNLYLYDNETVNKLDTNGRQRLTQSAKSFGRITKIDASSWLKIALFSEAQQQICYLDNALAVQNNCIDLAKSEVDYATNFSTSLQTDRIWVYDQLNSELQLITIRTNQKQIVQNLKSLVDLGNVTQLFEFQNELYVADDLGQLVKLDNFGTFIGGITPGGEFVQPYAKGLLYLKDDVVYATNTENERDVPFFFIAPETLLPVEKFHFTGKLMYFSTADKLYCYAMKQ